MEQNSKTNPTVGYWRNEQRTFYLREGETLPKGWYNSAAKAQSRSSGEFPPGDPIIQRKKRGRPRKSQENDEEPGAELASELRDE
jgi:hypothetical protein